MARAALGLSNAELAVLAKVAPNTVSRFELGGDIRKSNADAIETALNQRGIVFVSAGQVATVAAVGMQAD
jgi:transcriptional regulator with XRE-family HTH domain